MLEIKNTRVYDLKESIIACRNAMRLEMPDYDDDVEFEKGLERAKKLVQASKNGTVKCHDNFLTGIRVSFDIKYTQYLTKQLQRYHWLDYVSSSSLMHRLVKMDANGICNKYVASDCVDILNDDIGIYNSIAESDEFTPVCFPMRDGTEVLAEDKATALYIAYMKCISDCPMGAELFTRVSTNYKQLQTIYFQRKNHKLKEDWGEFIKWIEGLPYAHELIIGDCV